MSLERAPHIPTAVDRLRRMMESSDLMGALPVSEIDTLARYVQTLRFTRGQLVFSKRDDATGVMFVVEGRVKITSVSPDGTEVILNIIRPGQVFGELAMLDGKPRSADAVAAEDTVLLLLPRKDFLEVLARHPGAAMRMMEILCERVRQATAFVEDAVLLDARARLAHRIRGFAAQYGEARPDGFLRIEHGLSQQELGESVGLTRVSVNRILSQWRDRGLIRDGRGWIEVRDLGALEDD